MHVITLPNGLRVDLGAATVSLSSRWTSDDRAKEGLAADIVCASIDAPVIAGNGFTAVETICDTAGGATRRARVVTELIEKAVTRRAELLATMPAEDLTPPAPVAAPVPAAPTSPAFVYAGERGSDLEDLLDGYDHGTAFYTSPQPAPAVAKPVKAPAKPSTLPTPVSNNDEIAKALVRRATYDAAELGNTVAATNVQCVFEAYVSSHKLSEKRAAGVKAKCEALGYVW